MASYRPFPQPPSQNPLPQQRLNQYNQTYSSQMTQPPPPAAAAASSSFPQTYSQMPTNSNYQHYPHSSRPQQHLPPPPQYSYPQPPPPPPLESSFPPPPPPPRPPQNSVSLQPPPPQYYPSSSQYSQYGHQPMQPLQPPQQPQPPPPPPSSPPPGSSIQPPPPPPTSPPPPPPSSQDKESGIDRGAPLHERDKGVAKERRDQGHSNRGIGGHKQQKVPVPVPPGLKKASGPPGRVETEEERRLRKKKEFEKHRLEEKHRQQLKESQNTVLQKTQMLSSGKGGHGSMIGSRMGDRRTTPLLGGERIENRLKKPTTFLCKLKFRNELPDTSAPMKLMNSRRDRDRFTKYTITSLEKNYKPQLFVEPDLGIPLDLLDLSVYNPPSVKPPLDPEDEELLRDDEAVTPVKKDGIRRKERPTDKGVSWLVKTQYISPFSMESTKQSLTEKQAKELREMKGGHNILENLNDRERQIKEIEASFEACKLPPVHATDKSLRPVEVLPLFPDFDRYEDKLLVAAFDGAPTADSEIYGKLDPSARDDYESRAIMKSFVASGSDAANPEKFLAYMVPSPNELSKDMYDENEDVSYSWVREYHWHVRGEDMSDPTTFLVSFDDEVARYVPLPTKLNLRKKKAIEGRSGDEVEHFPIPSRVTVRRRPTAAAIELRDIGVGSSSKGSGSSSNARGVDDGLERTQQVGRHQDNGQSSGAEDDLSV